MIPSQLYLVQGKHQSFKYLSTLIGRSKITRVQYLLQLLNTCLRQYKIIKNDALNTKNMFYFSKL